MGYGGFVLGGGWGNGLRQLGLAADALVSARVVLANGTAVTASASENADLFWAMRGGGGANFGVSTRYTLRAHEVPWPDHVLNVSMTWPLGSPGACTTNTSAMSATLPLARTCTDA